MAFQVQQESARIGSPNDIVNRFYRAYGQPSNKLSDAKQFHHVHMNKMVTILKTIDSQLYSQNMVLGYTGSTYEKTNIGDPIDLDTMIIMPERNVIVAESSFPGFFYLQPIGHSTSKYSKLMEGEWISPLKFRRKFYGDIQKCLNQMPRWSFEYTVRMRDGGVSAQQDVYKHGTYHHSVDTIPTLKINEAYYIPKPATRDYDTMTWRKSWSFEELVYLTNLDQQDDGIRRVILRTLKAMKKKDSTFQCLKSYHLKTWVMHVSVQHEARQWKIKNLADRMDDVMSYAIESFRKNVLPHFFNEQINLYADDGIQTSTLQQMANRMKLLRPNGGKEFENFFKVDTLLTFMAGVNSMATVVGDAAAVVTGVTKAIRGDAAQAHNDEADQVNQSQQICPNNGNDFEQFLAVVGDTAEAVKVVSNEVVQAYRYVEDLVASNDTDQDTECCIQ